MKESGGTTIGIRTRGNWSIIAIVVLTIIELCCSDYEQVPQAKLVSTGGLTAVVAAVVDPSKELGGLYPGPYFDTERNPQNITAIAGSNAYLPCYVKQLGNKTLSWIRTWDSHILTVDRYTFIADPRFQVIPSGDSWTLQIKSVQSSDETSYECQISTSPKLAFKTHLHVLKPTIRINTAEENIFVWEGSRVELRCVIQFHQPTFHRSPKWLRNDEELKLVSYKDLVLASRMEGTSLITTAVMPYVRLQNAGNYSCVMESIGSATVTLHVLTGENPAANIMSNISAGNSLEGHTNRDMMIILMIISNLLQGIFYTS